MNEPSEGAEQQEEGEEQGGEGFAERGGLLPPFQGEGQLRRERVQELVAGDLAAFEADELFAGVAE